MSGVYKTLQTMLQTSMPGVQLLYGEENINSQELVPPCVVMVPTGGSFRDPKNHPGYYKNADLYLRNLWMKQVSIDLYLWAKCETLGVATDAEHADAVEALERQCLIAMAEQAPNGLKFEPVSDRASEFARQVLRDGRGCVLTVQADVTIPGVLSQTATVTGVTTTTSIEGA